MLYEKDGDPSLIRSRRVAILGFGGQGRAQALNLRDSGVEIIVGLRENSSSRAAAEAAGLAVATPEVAVAGADVVVMLVPDTVQPEVYRQVIAPHLKPGGAVIFAHGYCVHFKQISLRQDMDILLVAPLGVGEQVRAVYERGGGVPGMIAVKQDASGNGQALALSYALANGHGRAGIIETDFAQETETDLFAEQVVLCGGLTQLIQAGFDTLVDAGYDPQIAYFCCLHEVKLLADLIHQRGIAGMRESISPIAEYGDYTRGPRVINAQSRAAMREILDEIRDGSFACELAADLSGGQPVMQKGRQTARENLLEKTGKRLRDAMPWIKE